MGKSIKRAFINTGKLILLIAWAIASVYSLSITMLYLPGVIASIFVLRFFLF